MSSPTKKVCHVRGLLRGIVMSNKKNLNLKKFYIGVDVGGTSIKFGVFDGNKKFIDKFYLKYNFK